MRNTIKFVLQCVFIVPFCRKHITRCSFLTFTIFSENNNKKKSYCRHHFSQNIRVINYSFFWTPFSFWYFLLTKAQHSKRVLHMFTYTPQTPKSRDCKAKTKLRTIHVLPNFKLTQFCKLSQNILNWYWKYNNILDQILWFFNRYFFLWNKKASFQVASLQS